MSRLLTFLADCAALIFCWACYHLIVRVPLVWASPLETRLLPWVGCYAYNDTWAEFRANMAWLRERGQP